MTLPGGKLTKRCAFVRYFCRTLYFVQQKLRQSAATRILAWPPKEWHHSTIVWSRSTHQQSFLFTSFIHLQSSANNFPLKKCQKARKRQCHWESFKRLLLIYYTTIKVSYANIQKGTLTPNSKGTLFQETGIMNFSLISVRQHLRVSSIIILLLIMINGSLTRLKWSFACAFLSETTLFHLPQQLLLLEQSLQLQGFLPKSSSS